MSIVKTYKANPKYKFLAHASPGPGCPLIFYNKDEKDKEYMFWDPDKRTNNKIFFKKSEFKILKKLIRDEKI